MADRVELLVRGTVVNVLSGELEEGVIAVDEGTIVGLSERPAKQTIETEYIVPGLINAHMHVESSMVTLPQYGDAVLPHGVTCVVADPHEIANVLGERGVRSMIEDAALTPLKARFTVPSCVPASPLQEGGATLDAGAVKRLLELDKVVGLAEVMDVDAVVSGDEQLHEKIRAAREQGFTIDGHLPDVTGERLQEAARYLDNDHESTDLPEAKEKIQTGLWIHIREGSSRQNLDDLKRLIEEIDTRRLSLCTDNFYATDLVEHGGIGQAVSKLIRDGYDPVEVIQMATLNTAEKYGLETGKIKPGAPADLVLVDDLTTWDVEHTIVDGVVDPSRAASSSSQIPQNTVTVPAVTSDDLAIAAPDEGRTDVRVIDHSHGTADKMIASVPSTDGYLCGDTEKDLLPIAVVDRHGKDGSVGAGFVHSLGLDRGAIGSTIAHDAHNLIVAGATHEAMATLVNHIRETEGGLFVYDPHPETITSLSLPIAGLMANEPVSTVVERYSDIEAAAQNIGLEHPDGIMALDNISLEVIPELRLTNKGLVDSTTMEYTDVIVDS